MRRFLLFPGGCVFLEKRMPSVAVLGSTGSIGTNTLEVIGRLGPDFDVAALAAGSNWSELARQAGKFNPELVVIGEESVDELRDELPGGVDVASGAEGLERAASLASVDIVVLAVTGSVGLPAAIAALREGKRLALANKESMVMAGALLNRLAAENDAEIIPVDSEHSAVFQAMHSGAEGQVRRIIITASGGPFLDTPAERLADVTPEQALDHPTWSMGPKITVDSATLMNKALEVIEARWLFDVKPEMIEVVVHPQSIVHSLVEFCDKSVLAQMGYPDMQLPIQYALTYPLRRPMPLEPLDLAGTGKLSFRRPDTDRFPGLNLGFRAAREGGTAGVVLNAANEIAVEAFLDERISFSRIPGIVEVVMDCLPVIAEPSIEQIYQADTQARVSARRLCGAPPCPASEQ